MQPVSASTLLANLAWRYSTKRFDPGRRIPGETWAAIEEAMVLSPSSFGLQPWRFVVVEDAGVRARLREHAWNKPQVTEASRLVVFARVVEVDAEHVDRHIQRVSAVRGVPPAAMEEYRKGMLGSMANPAGLAGGSMETWTRAQVYIALGVFLTSCAMLGVDACPMEGFSPAGFDQILGLRERGCTSVVLGAAGYRAVDDAFAAYRKVRFDAREVVVRV
jgi:nitroreductase